MVSRKVFIELKYDGAAKMTRDDQGKDLYGFVYMTTNNINGKKYIGAKKYSKYCECYLGSGKLLVQDIREYGANNFSRKTIEECCDKKELYERERHWINHYGAVESNEFYNMAKGGIGGDTYCAIVGEDRDRLIAGMRRRSAGNGNPMFGKHHSKETIDLIKRLHKIRYSKKENNPNYGKFGAKNPNSHWIYCKENNTIYPGIRQASRETGIPSPNIIRALKSGGKFSAGKYFGNRMHWYYLSETNLKKEDYYESN